MINLKQKQNIILMHYREDKGTGPLSFQTLAIIYGGRPHLDSKGIADKSLSLCLPLSACSLQN
jgi:hypothetical protein